MPLFVRRLRISDLPRLEEIEARHENESPTRKGWQSRVRKLIELALSDEPEGLLIADQDGKVVGWAAARQRPLHPLSTEGVGHVLHISVSADARRSGIGARLLRECEAYLRARGCSGIRISVRVDDTASQQLMKKLGYSAAYADLERKFYAPGGRA